MKKIFSLLAAIAFCFAANATEYYLAGEAVGWSPDNETYKFQEVNGVLTLVVNDFYGEFKVTEDGKWHPQHGAAAEGEGVKLGGSYTLVKCDDSNGEADAPANARVITGKEGDYRYKNAKLTLDASNPNALVISLVEGELYDHSAAPISYYLVGGCTDNWNLLAAVEFVDVNGVLTANVPNLNGAFKIVYDRAWGKEYASNGSGLVFGEPYTTVLGGGDISFSNPFAGYLNAVVTLEIKGDDHIITVVSGEFNKPEYNWYFPGTKIGWNLDNSTQFEPVAGKENTYEYLAPEFGGDFKVVYGSNWEISFGASNEGDKWEINKEYIMTYPATTANGGNLFPAVEDAVYIDVTATITVDYEAGIVKLLISDLNETAVENVKVTDSVVKNIVNGQLVIEKNGVKYNVLGAEIK